MKKDVLFKSTFPSERNVRQQVLDAISSALMSYKLSTVITGDEIILAVDEAITNAMEHGNKWDPQKKIHVEIIENSISINIKITDEGDGFKIPRETRKDPLSPRGYGLHLINQFCKATWNEKGNSVNLKFFFKAS